MSGIFGGNKPKPIPAPTPIPAPVVNQEVVDRSTEDIMRRRRGSAATIATDSSTIGSTAGSVASNKLLG